MHKSPLVVEAVGEEQGDAFVTPVVEPSHQPLLGHDQHGFHRVAVKSALVYNVHLDDGIWLLFLSCRPYLLYILVLAVHALGHVCGDCEIFFVVGNVDEISLLEIGLHAREQQRKL